MCTIGKVLSLLAFGLFSVDKINFDGLGMLVGLSVSFLVSLALVLTTRWHGKYSLDGLDGVQKFHAVPTPRIGGIAILAGLVCALMVTSEARQALLAPMLVAGLPAFFFGVAEDVTKRVSVRTRLFATMFSGALAWYLTGYRVGATGIWGIDAALEFLPFSVLFTAFAVGGVANAVNIIDGFNGLASGTVTLSLCALGLIALHAGDTDLARVCFIVAGVTLGFFFVNFPFGKLFLGDGGAYLLGFVLAWLAVMLPVRNTSVSVWAPLLACGYPIFETVFTIARRMWTGTDSGQADSNHLHSLVKVAICKRYFTGLPDSLRNASVSPFSWAIAAVPAFLAVEYAHSTRALVWAALISFTLYVAVYGFLASMAAPGASRGVALDGIDEQNPGTVA